MQLGPARPPLFQELPTQWQRRAVAVLAFVLGVAAGAGSVLWWQARAAPVPLRVDEHAVELVLFQPVPPTPPADREAGRRPLRVVSAFFLSGGVTSTVLTIDNLDRSLDVRTRALPVTVSPTARVQLVDLEIVVRDCKAATRWTPVDRPFAITWRDEGGKMHLDRAGDVDTSTASSLMRYVDAACASPRNR